MRLALLASAVLALAACSRGESDAAANTAADAPPPASAAAGAPGTAGGDPCVLGALWTECVFRKRIENSGLAPVLAPLDSSLRFAGAETYRWRLGRGEVHAFFFPSQAAADAAFASLDSATASPRGAERIDWPEPPVLLRSANLLVVLASSSVLETERITDAVSAGLPKVR